MLAEEAVIHAERVLAGATEFARVVRDSRIDHDAIARTDRGDVRSHGLDDPGAVRSDDVGKAVRRPRHALRNK